MKTYLPQAPKTGTELLPKSDFSIIGSMPEKKFQTFLQNLPEHLSAHLYTCWEFYARPDQLPPETDWLIWLLMGGRGSGKTRAGAEWVREQVQNLGKRRIALVGPTYSDVREVMLGGESGLLNLGYPAERPKYLPSRRRLEWPNGATGQIFTAEDPDGLRGPQFDGAWADEFCAWAKPEETLSNLRFGLRLGLSPRLVITTTPKPTAAFKKLIETEGVVIARAKTLDNEKFLAPTFVSAMTSVYGGTRKGRQELNGELLLDLEGALWSRKVLEICRVSNLSDFDKIIVSIDPPVTSGPRADKCGIIVAGRTKSLSTSKAINQAVILHDGTISEASPEMWARHAVGLYEAWDADYLLVEVNQGGDMVRSVIGAVDPKIPVKTVFATRSKTIRAEPIALLYEQGRVKHFGCFQELEDELCGMGATSTGQTKPRSPDRADALVWAVTDLLLKTKAIPRIRTL